MLFTASVQMSESSYSSKLLEKNANKTSEFQTDDTIETANFDEDNYEGSISSSRRCTIDSVASMNDSDFMSNDGVASISTSRRSTVDSLQSLNDSIPSTIDSRRSTVDSVAFTGSKIDLSLVKAEPHSDDDCATTPSKISVVQTDMTTIKTEIDIKAEPTDRGMFLNVHVQYEYLITILIFKQMLMLWSLHLNRNLMTMMKTSIPVVMMMMNKMHLSIIHHQNMMNQLILI